MPPSPAPNASRTRSSSHSSTTSHLSSLSLSIPPPLTTLTLLPTTLALVNIPRARTSALAHPILAHLLPCPSSPTTSTSSNAAPFLAIVANALELSIYADAGAVSRSGFLKIARREHERAAKMGREAGRRRNGWRPVEISAQRWSVLQVESHDDRLDSAGSRVHQITSALASASIPLLFLSSHTADFILVKSCRLADAIGRLGMEGYGVWSEGGLSPFLGPIGGGRGGWMETHGGGEEVVLAPLVELDEGECEGDGEQHGEEGGVSPAPSTNSLSTLHPSTTSLPPSLPIHTLPHPLATVGLAEDSSPLWELKLFKLVSFPELLFSSPDQQTSSPTRSTGLAEKERVDEEWDEMFAGRGLGVGATAEEEGEASSGTGSEGEYDDYDDFGDDALSSSSPGSSRSSSPTSSTTSSIPQQPHSHSTTRARSMSPTLSPSAAALPFFALTRTRDATSLTASTRVLRRLFTQEERYMVMSAGELDLDDDDEEEVEEEEDEDAPEQGAEEDEEYFDAVNSDVEEDEGGSESELESVEEFGEGPDHEPEPELLDYHESEHEPDSRGPLRCLQVDLSAFPLDKVGLAQRLSDALHHARPRVDHLYASTFRTANLLVPARDVRRARRLLEAA